MKTQTLTQRQGLILMSILIGIGMVFCLIGWLNHEKAMRKSVVVEAKIIKSTKYVQGILRMKFKPRIYVSHSAKGYLDTVSFNDIFYAKNISYEIGDCCFIQISKTDINQVNLLVDRGIIKCY